LCEAGQCNRAEYGQDSFHPESPWFKNHTDHTPIPPFADSVKLILRLSLLFALITFGKDADADLHIPILKQAKAEDAKPQ
jgi:hypothetical protein